MLQEYKKGKHVAYGRHDLTETGHCGENVVCVCCS